MKGHQNFLNKNFTINNSFLHLILYSFKIQSNLNIFLDYTYISEILFLTTSLILLTINYVMIYNFQNLNVETYV